MERVTLAERTIQCDQSEWYLTRILPYRFSFDRIEGVVITFVEITELRMSELVLRESEERFRALMSASAPIVWNADAVRT